MGKYIQPLHWYTFIHICLCVYFVKRIRNGCPCTAVNASDLHNARTTILLNPFYYMEYQMIKKMKQNTARIESDIQGKNLTPIGKMHSPQPLSSSARRHNHIQLSDVTIATQRTLLREHVNGAQIVLKSTDRRSNISQCLYVQGLIHWCLMVFSSREIKWNRHSKCGVLHCHVNYKWQFTVLIENDTGDRNRRLSRVHYIVLV